MSSSEATDLFLHATRAGLLELRFNLICPGSRAARAGAAGVRRLAFGRLPGGEGGAQASLTLEAKPGVSYRLLSLDNHSQVVLQPSGVAREVEFSSTVERMSPPQLDIGLGSVVVRVVNRGASPMGFFALRVDVEGMVGRLVQQHPNQFQPFLTARTPSPRCAGRGRQGVTCDRVGAAPRE